MNYNNAEFYTSYGSFKQIPKSERTEIAFSGRSNVGKSSLINKIFMIYTYQIIYDIFSEKEYSDSYNHL